MLPAKETGLNTVVGIYFPRKRRFEEISAAKSLKTGGEMIAKQSQNKTKARAELLASLIPAKLAHFDERYYDYFACESRDESRACAIET